MQRKPHSGFRPRMCSMKMRAPYLSGSYELAICCSQLFSMVRPSVVPPSTATRKYLERNFLVLADMAVLCAFGRLRCDYIARGFMVGSCNNTGNAAHVYWLQIHRRGLCAQQGAGRRYSHEQCRRPVADGYSPSGE